MIGMCQSSSTTSTGVEVGDDKDRQRNVYYDSAQALGDGSGQSVYEILGYRMTRKGLVNGIALSQTTN
jgi:hypothetical protein